MEEYVIQIQAQEVKFGFLEKVESITSIKLNVSEIGNSVLGLLFMRVIGK